MYAVISTGGKQLTVSSGDFVRVEKLPHGVGETVELNEILMIRGRHKFLLGDPMVKDSKVIAEVTRQSKSKKVLIGKKRKRKGYARKAGHRQFFTELKIKEIVVPAES